MGLLNQLIGEELPKLPVHQFWASLQEVSHGELTIAQVKSYFQLSQESSNDLDWLVGKYQASTDKPEFLRIIHVIFMLAETSAPGYSNQTDLVARINRIP